VRGPAHDALVEDGLAVRRIKRRDGNTPRTLARDAPVRTRLHGAADPVDSPVRDPLDPVDLLEHELAEGPAAACGSGLRAAVDRMPHGGHAEHGAVAAIVVHAEKPLVHG